jgi:hypothetical protein
MGKLVFIRVAGLRFDEIGGTIERWRCDETSAGSNA